MIPLIFLLSTFVNILLIVLIILSAFVLISVFLPSKVSVERSMVMQASAERVFEQVNNLKKWPQWMPWIKLDPNMDLSYGNQTEGEGASYSWSSNKKNVGNGKLTIMESKPHRLIVNKIEFGGQRPGRGSWRFEEKDGKTKVTWRMDSDMGINPMNKFFGLMMDKMVGGSFESGLADIKQIVEAEANS